MKMILRSKITMRLLVLVLFFAAISCKNKEQNQEVKNAQTRPNIVFIMSDDHGYQAISAYSDKLIHTHNIDRIAKEGMLFTNASVTNSICAPSRAVILTGKHSHINGKIDNLSKFDTTNITFPQLLQKAGYQTAMFGKLHFGNNPKGFDEFKILPRQGKYYNPKFITNIGDTTITGYVTDITTDLALDWMENRRKKDKPFLLMYFHKAPHRPWLPKEKYYKKYTKKTFPIPENLFDNYSDRGTAAHTAEMNILKHMSLVYDNKLTPETMNELGIKDWNNLPPHLSSMNQEQRISWDSIYDPISEDFKKRYPTMNDSTLMVWKFQRYMQDYLGTIASVDENVGRVLDYLDKNDLTDNTLVVYTSDQGFYLGEHGWFDKRFMYNESFKTPLLVRWPHVIKPGITEDEMVQNLDFAHTFLDMAGVQAPKDIQGESLVPLFKGAKNKWEREAVYYHYYEYPAEHAVKRHYGIATKRYKLIHFYYDVNEWELYDEKKDPMEMHNVYHNPAYADVVKEMTQKLKEIRKKYLDSDKLDQEFIDLYSTRRK